MVRKRTFKQFLAEMPVTDYKTFGNFDKAHSFRHANDRAMVTAEKAVRNIHKRLGKTDINLNLYFVNAPGAGKHSEVGEVSMGYVEKNLPKEVAQHLDANEESIRDSINIIYTNNSGAERVPLTPWMLMHRFMHAVRRKGGMNSSHGAYVEAERHLQSQVKTIMSYYGRQNFDVERRWTGDYEGARKDQLAFKYLFQHIATFKSARDHKIRDYFEVLNELGSQYVVTNKILFNDPPRCIEGGSFGSKQNFCASSEDMEELTEHVHMLARDMEFYIRDILNSAVGNIYVM